MAKWEQSPLVESGPKWSQSAVVEEPTAPGLPTTANLLEEPLIPPEEIEGWLYHQSHLPEEVEQLHEKTGIDRPDLIAGLTLLNDDPYNVGARRQEKLDQFVQGHQYQGFWRESARQWTSVGERLLGAGAHLLYDYARLSSTGAAWFVAPETAPQAVQELDKWSKVLADDVRSEHYDPAVNGGFGGFLSQVIPQVTAYMGTSMIAGLVAGPIGAFGVGLALEGEDAYREAKAANAPEGKAQFMRWGVGSAVALLDVLELRGLLRFGRRVTKAAETPIAREVAQEIGQKTIQKLTAKAGRIGAEMGKVSVFEAVTETLQQLMADGSAILVYHKEFVPKEMLYSAAMSFAGGAFGAFMMAPAFVVFTGRGHRAPEPRPVQEAESQAARPASEARPPMAMSVEEYDAYAENETLQALGYPPAEIDQMTPAQRYIVTSQAIRYEASAEPAAPSGSPPKTATGRAPQETDRTAPGATAEERPGGQSQLLPSVAPPPEGAEAAPRTPGGVPVAGEPAAVGGRAEATAAEATGPYLPDATGQPQVFFHGTTKEFADAEIAVGQGALRQGIYLTHEETAAQDYGKVKRYVIQAKPEEVLDLSDGDTLYEYLKSHDLLDADQLQNPDLQEQVRNGRLFQYDIDHKTNLADDVIAEAASQGFKVVRLADDLGGRSDNVATVVTSHEVLTPVASVIDKTSTTAPITDEQRRQYAQDQDLPIEEVTDDMVRAELTRQPESAAIAPMTEPEGAGRTEQPSPQSQRPGESLTAADQARIERAKNILKYNSDYSWTTLEEGDWTLEKIAELERRAQAYEKPAEHRPTLSTDEGQKATAARSLPDAVKSLGRQRIEELVGEWDANAHLSEDGTSITTYADPRNQTGKIRASSKEFLDWLRSFSPSPRDEGAETPAVRTRAAFESYHSQYGDKSIDLTDPEDRRIAILEYLSDNDQEFADLETQIEEAEREDHKPEVESLLAQADAIVAQMEAAITGTPPTPLETTPTTKAGKAQAPTAAATQAADQAYRAMRKRELGKTTRYIKESAEYQLAQQESEAKGFTPTGVGLFYVEPKYRGDVEGAFGQKSQPGSNREAWRMISFDRNAGQAWDVAQQELGWGTTFDEFLSRLKDFAAGDIAPDVLDVAQASGNIDLETAALKRSMLQSGHSVTKINAAIEENVKGAQQSGYIRLTDAEVDAIVAAHKIKMAAGEMAALEYDESVGAAKGNFPSRRRALDRAQKQSGKTGKPWYVVQRSNGTYAAQPNRPKRGHYTVVNMKAPLAEQVQLVKQASPTADESFDYAEHPKESQKHLTDLERFEARLTDNRETTDAIRDELYHYVTENVPPELQGKFLGLMRTIREQRRTKTNLQDLQKGIAQAKRLLQGHDKKDAIAAIKQTWSDIKGKYRRGIESLGGVDQRTRQKLHDLMDGIDLVALGKAKRRELESLARYLKGLSNQAAAGTAEAKRLKALLPELEQFEQNRLSFDDLSPDAQALVRQQVGTNPLSEAAQMLAEAQTQAATATQAMLNVPENSIKALRRLGQMPLIAMEMEDIDALRQLLIQTVHNWEHKDAIRTEQHSQQLGALTTEALGEVKTTAAAAAQPITEETGLDKPGFLTRLWGVASDHIDTMIHRIAGFAKGATEKLLFDGPWGGWVRYRTIKRQAHDFLQAKIKTIGFTEDDFTAMDDRVPVKLSNETHQLSRWEMLSLYMHSKDDYNVRQLLKARDIEVNGVPTPTVANVRELWDIIDQLTDKERALGDAATELQQTILMPAVNPQSILLEGVERAVRPNYWSTARSFPLQVAGRLVDVAIEDTGPWQYRTGGTARLALTPFYKQLADTIDSAASYAGMAVPMRNARTLLNSAQWQDALTKAGHYETLRTLITMYRRAQGYVSDTALIDSFGKKRLTRASRGILSIRLSSMVANLAGIPLIKTEFDPQYRHGVLPSAERRRQLLKHSAVLWERRYGHQFTIEAANSAVGASYHTMFFGKLPILDKGLSGLAEADLRIADLAGGMAENEIRATRPDLEVGSDAYWEAVARRTEIANARTQGSAEVFWRSEVGSDTSLTSRMLLLFRTPMEAQLNILKRARLRYEQSERTDADRSRYVRDVAAVAEAAFVDTSSKMILAWLLAKGAWASLMALGIIDPDDEPIEDKKALSTVEKGIWAMIQNLSGILPGGNYAAGIARNIYMYGKRGSIFGVPDLPQNPLQGMLSRGVDAAQSTVDLTKHLVTGAEYESGASDGGAKWKADLKKMIVSSLETANLYLGGPLSGPIAEVVRPVQQTLKRYRPYRHMSDDALAKAIQRQVKATKNRNQERLDQLLSELDHRRAKP